MLKTLTRRQKEILEFVRAYTAQEGYAPSIMEICGHFGLSSPATVHKHLSHLVAKGFIVKDAHRSRAVQVVPSDDTDLTETVELPLLGQIAAGEPIEALSGNETMEVPASLVPRGKRTFVLKVKGSSMVDEQIRDGDSIIVREATDASNGDTVVALVDGNSATLKKFYQEDEHIRLQPANKKMEPIIVKNDPEFRIQGIVVGLIRRY
ncbi:transcriptional repressor LexA [Candidatus Hydrogenedentota bacterium]